MASFKRLPKRRAILWLLTIFISIPLLAAMAEAVILTSPPRFYPWKSPADFGMTDYQDIEFRTQDGLLLRGWYVAPTRPDGASLLFAHGHLGNKGQLLTEAEWFYSMGYGLLFFNMRGHGDSEGQFTTISLLETQDVQAAYQFLQQIPEVNPERIGIYGHSMGGATSIRAMPRLEGARVLILDAPFADLQDTIRGDIAYYHLPPLFFPDLILDIANFRTGLNYRDARPIDVISQIEEAIFLMHGTNDNTVPTYHAYWLYENIQSAKFLYIAEGASHTQVFESNPEAFKTALLPFLEQYLVNN
jgi:dipeptidyl aminopeptidase/acylaminoacyl peptidase